MYRLGIAIWGFFSVGTGNGASSDNDRSNNNNKKSLIDNHDDRHSDAVDDVDDDVDEDDQDGAALGPLAGFQNLLAAAAAGGNNGTAAGEGEQQVWFSSKESLVRLLNNLFYVFISLTRTTSQTPN